MLNVEKRSLDDILSPLTRYCDRIRPKSEKNADADLF